MSLNDDFRNKVLQEVQDKNFALQRKDLGPINNFTPFNPDFNDQSAYDELDAYDKARLTALGRNWDGSAAGELNALYKKGSDAAQYRLKDNPLVHGADGSVGLRKELMLQGADQYTKPLLAQQDVEEKFGRDDAVSKVQQAQALAQSGQAMRGGMRAGNNALQARSSLRDLLMAQQGVSQNAMKNRADINAKGADVQVQNDRTNNSNLLKSIEGTNQFNLEKYKQKMNVEAANKQAEATRAAGQGGSWVCTEVHKRSPLSKKDAFALFKLRKYALKTFPGLAQFYLYDCSPLVDKMKEQGCDWSESEQFVRTTVALVEKGTLDNAFEYYVDWIFKKMMKFWPECDHPVMNELKGDIA